MAAVREAAAGFEFGLLMGWVIANWSRMRKPLIFAAVALYVVSGFYILSPDETGVIERFGRKLVPYREPGPHYKLPWPVDSLTRIKARRVRVVEIGFRTVDTDGRKTSQWRISGMRSTAQAASKRCRKNPRC